MLVRNKRLFWVGVGLLFVAFSFFAFPPYRAYCDSKYPNDYYCAAYRAAVALGTWVDVHNGAVDLSPSSHPAMSRVLASFEP